MCQNSTRRKALGNVDQGSEFVDSSIVLDLAVDPCVVWAVGCIRGISGATAALGNCTLRQSAIGDSGSKESDDVLLGVS